MAPVAARELSARLDEVHRVRVVYGDPPGLSRSGTVSARTFRTVLRNGMDFGAGLYVFDTGHPAVIDLVADGGGIGAPELTGVGDLVVVPDPLTFRVPPHPLPSRWRQVLPGAVPPGPAPGGHP